MDYIDKFKQGTTMDFVDMFKQGTAMDYMFPKIT
jgi:hypothetical protein